MSREFRIALLWMAAVAVAVFAQLNNTDASFFDGAYHPVSNDSFYHARRILDTAADPSAFYEFDPKIHAPEGSLITWPWGYDYAVAMIVRGVAHLVPGSDPLPILVHVPTAAVVVSITLLMAVAAMLGLSGGYLLLAGLATGLLPLTQELHGVGNIDQHYAEYIAVLGALAAGMAWLRTPGRPAFAALTGIVLGIAPAIHSALFILQLPLLLTIGLLWLKGRSPPTREIGAFAAALLLATAAIMIPSEPVRLGLFEYYRLSWFQLYIAGCTTAFLLFVSAFRCRPATLVALVVAAVLLCVPLLTSLHHAGAFFSREIAMNRTLQETQSVWELMSGPGGLRRGVGYYSGLLLVLPLTMALCVAGVLRRNTPERTLFFVTCLIGIPLLLSQARLHYFGSFALYLPPLMAASAAGSRFSRWRHAVLATTAALFFLAYWAPVKDRLISRHMPANDAYYVFSSMAMPALAEACRTDPGIVLAINNDGHYIRYHTDCSVISNNFLVTRQHEEKALQTSRLLGMTPDQMLASGVPVKYVLARASGILIVSDDGQYGLASKDMAASVTPQLYSGLLWSDPVTLGGHWRMLQEWRTPGEDGFVFMRLWKTVP